MKPLKKLLVTSVVAVTVAGAAQAWASPLSKDELTDSSGGIMSDIITYAGIGDFDDKNGGVLGAAFRSPTGVLVLADGSVLVSDSRNHLIRRINKGQVTTFAGPELVVKTDAQGMPVGAFVDGKAGSSFFNGPAGLAADAEGNVYVADAGNNAIRNIAPDGTVTTLAGDGVIGTSDGKGAAARFYHPLDIAAAADGTVYVADTLNNLIRKIAPDGSVSTLNAPSSRTVEISPGQAVAAGDFADGALQDAKFNEPSGLALDAKGNLYVCDTGNQRIRYIDFATGQVTTVAGSSMAVDGKSLYEKNSLYAEGDYADGDAAKAMFNFPQGIAVSDGGLLIADSLNHAIRYLSDGLVTTIAGSASQTSGETDGIEGFNMLQRPSDVALTADGGFVIADTYNNKIRKFDLYRLPDNLPVDDSVKVIYNGNAIGFGAKPEITDNRTMVPAKWIAEALGYSVETDPDGSGFRLKRDGSPTVDMAVGKTEMTSTDPDGTAEKLKIDVAPYIKEDHIYIPIRYFAEQAGLDVQWDQPHHAAILREKVFVK